MARRVMGTARQARSPPTHQTTTRLKWWFAVSCHTRTQAALAESAYTTPMATSAARRERRAAVQASAQRSARAATRAPSAAGAAPPAAGAAASSAGGCRGCCDGTGAGDAAGALGCCSGKTREDLVMRKGRALALPRQQLRPPRTHAPTAIRRKTNMFLFLLSSLAPVFCPLLRGRHEPRNARHARGAQGVHHVHPRGGCPGCRADAGQGRLCRERCAARGRRLVLCRGRAHWRQRQHGVRRGACGRGGA